VHPLLARRAHFALYLLLWLLVGVLLAVLFVAQGVSWSFAAAVALPLATAYAFVCLSAWYVSRGLPLPRSGMVRIGITAVTAAILSSGIWLLLAHAWMRLLAVWFPAAGPTALGAEADTLVFGCGVLLYLLSIAVSYVIAVYDASMDAERRGLRAEVLAREAELRALRAQIDPHFLFNSLHSISALTAADPGGARRMCLLLADFLRDSLALGGGGPITLARELAVVERFLEIERVRFGDRLGTDISADNAAKCLVPALLLQPIVENAVTHGIAHVLDGGVVRIRGRRSGDLLRIVVENPCDPERPRGRGSGVGLGNVRARLRALHEHGTAITVSEEAGVWRVELTLPAVETRAEYGRGNDKGESRQSSFDSRA